MLYLFNGDMMDRWEDEGGAIMSELDAVEEELLRAMRRTIDNDELKELAHTLKCYRENFKA